MRSASSDERLVVDLEPQPPAAAPQPAHQPVRLHGPDRDPAAARLQRPNPLRRLRVAIEAGREDDEQGVRIVPLQKCQQRVVARDARAPARQSQLEHPAGGEQREIAGRGADVVPVGAALQEVHLALSEARGARTRADRIRRLPGEQRLVAGYQVCRQEMLLEMRRQGIGCELQARRFGECRPTL